MRLAPVLLGLLALAAGPVAAAPARVVSMNLCADQLAMLLAAPGQLVSVSYLARDPHSSAMAAEAAAYPVNHGLAEEIFLLDPDLVLAGDFTHQPAVAMLRRLGVPVLVLAPASSLAEARAQILALGAALGREDRAAELIAEIDAGLAAAAAPPDDAPPRAAILGASGYASGPASLPGDVLAAAGFANILDPASMGGRLSLETLLMARPDLIVLPEPYPGWSRAEEFPRHPALLDSGAATLTLPDQNWVCGTPALLGNLAAIGAARREVAP
ncbi:MAG: ABC transporter substrate-binding protein [Rhodovulum sulfidophilum]|uniref:ABC transporter substrate-binding protein n=1 Tax=Rhodovulum sulfidophilum TaxID=35806 RepID=A0A2W5Q4Y5_RHOSU|nr:MAG: ABC transporter substrate-binding protein [Rhodovulum sulfidophilum]